MISEKKMYLDKTFLNYIFLIKLNYKSSLTNSKDIVGKQVKQTKRKKSFLLTKGVIICKRILEEPIIFS